jgi:hypothetical protein
MVPSSKLSIVANGNNSAYVGLALGSTIHFDSLELIANCLGCLSLSTQERDSSAIFVGMVHIGLPSLHTALEESSNKDRAISGVRGSSESPDHRGCNVVTPTDPITATPESTPAIQTIPMVKVRTTAPQPGMEVPPAPDQQQAYQEEKQAQTRGR